ncbi:hypothetical protein RHSIM_Rhsim04G0224000 [Rhododendron simsii]|uniref:Uncharacterized protein n=1 Tax=Rhododendron simsii TaxID=118357 RepID=A0A834LPP9_RHOSS|nr:hypothetical protein RHSIM_Rhsim04G0224000 [Rhododendron simsii]
MDGNGGLGASGLRKVSEPKGFLALNSVLNSFFPLRCAELVGPTLSCGWDVAKSCVPSIYGESCLRWKLKKNPTRATSHSSKNSTPTSLLFNLRQPRITDLWTGFNDGHDLIEFTRKWRDALP